MHKLNCIMCGVPETRNELHATALFNQSAYNGDKSGPHGTNWARHAILCTTTRRSSFRAHACAPSLCSKVCSPCDTNFMVLDQSLHTIFRVFEQALIVCVRVHGRIVYAHEKCQVVVFFAIRTCPAKAIGRRSYASARVMPFIA